MKKIFLVLTAALLTLSIFAQQGTIKGVIKDAETGETLIGANVLIKAGVGTVTDFNGEFTLQADPGEYNLTISYVGYEATKRKVKVIAGKTVTINVSLKTITLNEVQVVADVARSRETPVAFTNVLPAKIEEELGAQDIPMVLNSTPGVYATQQGGGDGDARITIRGFNQRNVAVMLDGIPVNDMENGWVYWSNWFGLDVVTRSIQVQRGLGASKLALPSVGGTMNIITKGIENKRNINIKQEVNSDG
ncbi:MAG: TonB-dependent receptor, partial [Bacteroidetes bacterium]